MSEENKIIPEGTILAYSKVSLEKQALSLELSKLSDFLANGVSMNLVSNKMYKLMENQLINMIKYEESLTQRLELFEEEYPGISEFKTNSKGAEIIGQFNPSGNKQVEEIKTRSAQLINCIDTFGKDPRRVAIAITDIEKAQMMAVKSLF